MVQQRRVGVAVSNALTYFMKKINLKSPRTVRGTATIHEDDRIEFKPYAEGEPAQRNVRSTKGGKVFTTTSEKKPLMVAHLSCPADATDPWQEYQACLAKLGICPQQAQSMPGSQRVVNEGGMEVFLDAKGERLVYQGCIDLRKSSNWQSDVMRQLQVIVRTLPVEENFKKVMNKIKKGGNK